MTPNDFHYRFAIQMPNGELLARPAGFYSANISRMFGLDSGDDDRPTKIQTWDTREDAQKALDDIRRDLAHKGIEWLAVVVQSYCTPFTAVDPAEHFANEVQQWLDGDAR